MLGLEGSGGSQILQHRISLPLEVGGGMGEKDHLERGYTVVSCRLFVTNVMQDCPCIYCLYVNHSMDSHACAENHTCALRRHFLHFDRQLASSSCLVFFFFNPGADICNSSWVWWGRLTCEMNKDTVSTAPPL